MRSDPAVYTLKKDGILICINANYVDDLLRAGTEEFCMECRKTHSKFEMKDEENPPFFFAGFRVEGDKSCGYQIDQEHYLKKL